ncbi:Replication factor C subunit [Fasciola hepatica]|uniref:Replication factor C subunit 3 n=1 Tax=Fasciola hepatica TaxID=6192 RepID=A0A4E0S0F2_FASHE|nr:Replication factor C subunit [Fasciola hepatica]
MSLWVDKYTPTSLSKLDYHQKEAGYLKNLVDGGNFPHLLFYGPAGAGKRTRIMCLLRELYGSGVDRLRMEHHEFLTPSNKKVNITTVSSNFHLEVNPSDVGIYDRIVIQELIKNMASTAQLDSTQQRDFKVVVLHEADHLTRDAQHALRRTMEKFISNCRLILSAESVSKIISATRSRCLPIRIAAPSVEQIADILRNTARREGLIMPPELATRIANASERNLRRALLLAEVAKWQHNPMLPDQSIQLPDWQTFLADTAAAILSEQSPRKIIEVRGRLYELLCHCIPADVIMRGLVDNLLNSCDGNLKLELVQLAAEHEHRLQLGEKPIFHLEAFIIAFMVLYKRFVEDALGSGMEW